jgi:hypothetical protein
MERRVNPFVYSRPVPPEDVVDRDAEVRDLLRYALGGHYVRLYAPRKYGKTSLLKRALDEGEREPEVEPRLAGRLRAIRGPEFRLERRDETQRREAAVQLDRNRRFQRLGFDDGGRGRNHWIALSYP